MLNAAALPSVGPRSAPRSAAPGTGRDSAKRGSTWANSPRGEIDARDRSAGDARRFGTRRRDAARGDATTARRRTTARTKRSLRDDSLSKWARELIPTLSAHADDPALGLTLDALGRGADAATATVREVATAVARQASTIDARIFDRLPEEAGRQNMGEVWAKINSSGASGTGSGNGLRELPSLPSLPTMNFMQLTTALASVDVGGSGTAKKATTRKTATATAKKATNGRATAVKKTTTMKTTASASSPPSRVSMMIVPTVPGVSYEPKRLKKRSGVATPPAFRQAIAPRKMGRKPKGAPKETEAEKALRMQERLFRNRESAARSREKRESAMRALEDENAALRRELAATKAKLAALQRSGGRQ